MANFTTRSMEKWLFSVGGYESTQGVAKVAKISSVIPSKLEVPGHSWKWHKVANLTSAKSPFLVGAIGLQFPFDWKWPNLSGKRPKRSKSDFIVRDCTIVTIRRWRLRDTSRSGLSSHNRWNWYLKGYLWHNYDVWCRKWPSFYVGYSNPFLRMSKITQNVLRITLNFWKTSHSSRVPWMAWP